MNSLTPSFYDANVGLFQLSQDAYDLLYQQNVNFYNYGQHQQSDQPTDGQHSMEPNQPQDRYDNYDQMTSNMRQNHLPPPSAQWSRKQPQKTLPNGTMHVLMKDRDDNSNRSGDKVFRRRPGACTRCKQVKMKCDFAPGEQACQRCKPKGYHCVVEFPKPKVYERERLLTEIRQKDAIIETLLKQLHNPYLATPHSIDEYVKSVPPADVNNPVVLGLLSRLKSGVQFGMGRSSEANELPHDQYNLHPHSEAQEHREMSTAIIESSCVPVGFRPEYEPQEFFPGPGFRLGNSIGLNYPEILVLGLVTLEDAEQLFDIFYKYINPFISILDPILHTPKSTLARCPILFTVICAIASRYHPRKSGIYRIAMHLAKYSAANSLVQDDMKSVELCQAYILMSIYAAPQRSWDRDQTWLYMGLAVNMATALRLDQTPRIYSATENKERESLNRVRVWQFCHLLDQAIAIRFGKPWTMKEHKNIRHSGEWYRQSQYNLDYDVYLCGYNVLVRIVARFHEEVLLDQSGFINSDRGNLRDVTMRYDVEIDIFQKEWKRKFQAGGAHQGIMLKRSQLHFYVYYYKLVIFSFGFHQAFHAGIEAWYHYFFTKCFEYAKSVIICMNEDLVPSGFMRYSPDRHFMCTTFAVGFLFKLLRPKFSSLLDKADRDESLNLIGILINKFSSSDIAVDDRHTPKLYAKFLATVLGKYQHSGQRSVFGGSDTFLPGHAGTSMNIARETNRESSDSWNKSQGYDSVGYTFTPEATHAAGVWPQFGDGIDFLSVIHEGENIWNGEPGRYVSR